MFRSEFLTFFRFLKEIKLTPGVILITPGTYGLESFADVRLSVPVKVRGVPTPIRCVNLHDSETRLFDVLGSKVNYVSGVF